MRSAVQAPVHMLGVDKKHIIDLEPVTTYVDEVTCENCIEQMKNKGHICHVEGERDQWCRWSQRSCMSCGGWDGLRGRGN